jgi:protein-L-isoaspartate(D-aspartate) O-methyltransferase
MSATSHTEQAVRRHQETLLAQVHRALRDTPLSRSTVEAYWATPRHHFITRYRQWATKDWLDVNEANLTEHLGALYGNWPLPLFGDDDDEALSTISQPQLVLRMLDLLQLEPGQKVLELGTGSGWNAALMSHRVGADGHIHTLELVPELCSRASEALRRQGIQNVSVVERDGGDGYPEQGSYDRIVFTAGVADLPAAFVEQLREGGRLLVVMKNPGGMDLLLVLEKRGDLLESRQMMLCSFVQITGKRHVRNFEPVVLEGLPEWPELAARKVSERRFWWAGEGRQTFAWRTFAIRWFLSVTEPGYQAFETERKVGQKPDQYFGLWGPDHRSLVVVRDDKWIAHGSADASERLLERVRHWVDLGMPGPTSFSLRVYPREASVTPNTNEWLARRSELQFLWRLPGR